MTQSGRSERLGVPPFKSGLAASERRNSEARYQPRYSGKPSPSPRELAHARNGRADLRRQGVAQKRERVVSAGYPPDRGAVDRADVECLDAVALA